MYVQYAVSHSCYIWNVIVLLLSLSIQPIPGTCVQFSFKGVATKSCCPSIIPKCLYLRCFSSESSPVQSHAYFSTFLALRGEITYNARWLQSRFEQTGRESKRAYHHCAALYSVGRICTMFVQTTSNETPTQDHETPRWRYIPHRRMRSALYRHFIAAHW